MVSKKKLLVFLIPQVQVIGSSTFLCLSPIISGVLWGVDSNILKIRSTGKQNLIHPLYEKY
jgi:hypothetical protein